MQFAVLGNVQGNIQAFEAAVADARERFPKLQRIIVAGDIVGLGPNPNEVLDFIRREEIDAIRGNYDDAIAFDRIGSGSDFATAAEELADNAALGWTRQALSEENMKFLRALPRDLRLSPGVAGIQVERDTEETAASNYRKTFFLRAIFGGLLTLGSRRPSTSIKSVMIVHGSPRALNEFIRPDTANSILETISRNAEADVIVSGHAGIGFQRSLGEHTYVGIPSASGPTAALGIAEYVVLDVVEQVKVEAYAVTYDAGEYRRAMRDAGLEEILGV